ncbi:MAG: hypothetical protein KJT03_00645 [Verrucomicrobiae bacterium]|nr:hypothetical protein [Verrucomicrobiae bacterium]
MTVNLKSLSYREKVVWINLIVSVAVFAYYFLSVLLNGLDGGQATWLYLKVVFFAIMAEIILISILSARDKTAQDDERDRLYQLKGYRWGYGVVLAGLGITLWQTLMLALGDSVSANPEMGEDVAQAITAFTDHASPFLIIHIMLATLTLAEIVKSAVQLFYYRRGY